MQIKIIALNDIFYKTDRDIFPIISSILFLELLYLDISINDSKKVGQKTPQGNPLTTIFIFLLSDHQSMSLMKFYFTDSQLKSFFNIFSHDNNNKILSTNLKALYQLK